MTPQNGILAQIITSLQAGRPCIFPTETFYALGCDALNNAAAEAVVSLKERRPDKGLPVIIGARSQVSLLTPLLDQSRTDAELARFATALMDAFWPGPLSLVLPARPELPPVVRGNINGNCGTVAVRQTPHPQAASLCLAAGLPLVATSANRSGQPPAAHKNALDPALTARVPLLPGNPEPAGGLPSTLVQPEYDSAQGYACRILRTGAILPETLRAAGFTVLPQNV